MKTPALFQHEAPQTEAGGDPAFTLNRGVKVDPAFMWLEKRGVIAYLAFQIMAMPSFFIVPKLTRPRAAFALAIALVADAVQIGLGPFGVTFLDDILDFVAMGLITWAVGFHPLLLPTLIIELVPFVDMVPTWTGCTVAVLMLRRRAEENPSESPPVTEAPPRIKQAQVLKDEAAKPGSQSF